MITVEEVKRLILEYEDYLNKSKLSDYKKNNLLNDFNKVCKNKLLEIDNGKFTKYFKNAKYPEDKIKIEIINELKKIHKNINNFINHLNELNGLDIDKQLEIMELQKLQELQERQDMINLKNNENILSKPIYIPQPIPKAAPIKAIFIRKKK
jgi:hypothetical protein